MLYPSGIRGTKTFSLEMQIRRFCHPLCFPLTKSTWQQSVPFPKKYKDPFTRPSSLSLNRIIGSPQKHSSLPEWNGSSYHRHCTFLRWESKARFVCPLLKRFGFTVNNQSWHLTQIFWNNVCCCFISLKVYWNLTALWNVILRLKLNQLRWLHTATDSLFQLIIIVPNNPDPWHFLKL